MTLLSRALHIEKTGSGSPVILLHGWGMHAGVFSPLSQNLAQNGQAMAVDLPGHGESAPFEHFAELDVLADYMAKQLLPVLESGAVLLGWSMGGLLAQAIAMAYPQYIRKLVLMCSTPCFIQTNDWSCAIKPGVLDSFAAELQRDDAGTLSRFLSLQFFGSSDQKVRLREARSLLLARPRAQSGALAQGLDLLKRSDLRSRLGGIHCPTLVINAEHDTLVPAAAGQYLAEQVVNGRCVIIHGAGHAPFLSHTAIVMNFLDRFLDEH